MPQFKQFFLGSICLIFLAGCGLSETVVQKEQVGALVFTGEVAGAVVQIDELAPLDLNATDRNVRFEISSGKHHIVVLKNGEKIVDRVVLLGSGSDKEISIP